MNRGEHIRKSRAIWMSDGLPVVLGVNSASVAQGYLALLINSKTDYAAPVGSEAVGAELSNGKGKTVHIGEGKAADDDVRTDVPVVQTKEEWVDNPKQKLPALLRRVIEASGNKDHMVFYPLYGCTAMLVAADGISRQRQRAGIDTLRKLSDVVVNRIRKAQGTFLDIKPKSDILKQADIGKSSPPHSLCKQRGENCEGSDIRRRIEDNFHAGHIIAKSKGGTDYIKGLRLASRDSKWHQEKSKHGASSYHERTNQRY